MPGVRLRPEAEGTHGGTAARGVKRDEGIQQERDVVVGDVEIALVNFADPREFIEVFDDAATGQGLLNYFLRAINCGAITAGDALSLTSLTESELRTASFVRILEGRKQ